MTLASFLLLGVAVGSAVTSQLIFKHWVAGLGVQPLSASGLVNLISRIFQSPSMILGILLYGAGFLAWMFLISRNSLSLVYPLSLSLNIFLVFLFARVFLSEPITLLQVIGVAAIIGGMYLLLAK